MINESSNAHIKLNFLNHEIEHVRQEKNYDCGAACLRMGLNYIYKLTKNPAHSSENLDNILNDLSLHKDSLWTIDIAHICSLKNLKHTMFTVTLGVQETYEKEQFYSSKFHSDVIRVNDLFKNSKSIGFFLINKDFFFSLIRNNDFYIKKGINVIKQNLSLDYIKNEIVKRSVCIVLINVNDLNGENLIIEGQSRVFSADFDIKINSAMKTCCLFGSNNKNNNNYGFSFSEEKASGTTYAGHYIVLVGYDDMKEIVFYLNPAASAPLSFASYKSFEKARKAFGTDEDILFIYT